MIVDIHAHIFPPDFIRDRARLCGLDPRFAEMYANPRAAMATAEDLRESMAEAAVDVSVASGFWWSDASLAAEHAAYLVETAAASGGAVLAFVPQGTPPPGATGIGEVREEAVDAVPDALVPLLVHSSEEIGHQYAGKAGGLTPGGLWRLLESRPEARVIAAHWGGGFPFYALMPEVADVIASGRVLFDTAATRYLYQPEVFARAIDLVGVGAIAWGSDFPLRSQAIDLAEARDAIADESAREAILGGNAARFLRLE